MLLTAHELSQSDESKDQGPKDQLISNLTALTHITRKIKTLYPAMPPLYLKNNSNKNQQNFHWHLPSFHLKNPNTHQMLKQKPAKLHSSLTTAIYHTTTL